MASPGKSAREIQEEIQQALRKRQAGGRRYRSLLIGGVGVALVAVIVGIVILFLTGYIQFPNDGESDTTFPPKDTAPVLGTPVPRATAEAAATATAEARPTPAQAATPTPTATTAPTLTATTTPTLAPTTTATSTPSTPTVTPERTAEPTEAAPTVLPASAPDTSRAPTPDSIAELRTYALNLINADRLQHGVPPVVLGNNEAAQVHADDAVRHGYYLGHWTSDGLKPYMLYQRHGGGGVVAENAAAVFFPPETIAQCEDPLVVCTLTPPGEAIAELQWSMMYDDAESDWGHRDTIINPGYDTVNIGIAQYEFGTAFYQHFEYVGVGYPSPPTIRDGILSVSVRPLSTHQMVAFQVYYDPLPEPRAVEEISSLRAYCTGGGFTDQCDSVAPKFNVLMPPELRWGARYSYVGLDDSDVIADRWVDSDGAIHIEADVKGFAALPGVYTLMFWSDEDEPRVLSEYSIFQ